jgi:hypothetical protein
MPVPESKIALLGDFYPDGFVLIFIRKIPQASRGVHFYPETTPQAYPKKNSQKILIFVESRVFIRKPPQAYPKTKKKTLGS